MNDTTNFRERLDATKSRLLDLVNFQIEQMAERTIASPAPPVEVARRAFANTVKLWMFCDQSRCRRSKCCRGEPRHCLRIGFTLLPPEAFDHLLERNKGRAGRARKSSASVAPSACP
jgi:hypothetical protein